MILVSTSEYNVIEFDSKKHPYHHSIQRQTIDGKIPDDFEAYFCIVPLQGIYTINDGDFIWVDDMNNAKGVIYKWQLEQSKQFKIKE